MKRIALAGSVALASGLILAACLPPIPAPIPLILSSPTPIPPQTRSSEITPTQSSTLSIESSSTPTLNPTSVFTPIPSFTSTFGSTGTTVPVGLTATIDSTGTAVPLSLTVVLITDTAASAASINIDKLPANTIYKPAHIRNHSGTQVDIALHCTTNKGLQTILEYNNIRNISTNLPEGNYVYVVYVGGRQVVGSFSFMTAPKLLIAVYEDRVEIH